MALQRILLFCVTSIFILCSCGTKNDGKSSEKNSRETSTQLKENNSLELATEVCPAELSEGLSTTQTAKEQNKCEVKWYAPLNVYPYGAAGPFKSKTECELKKGYFTGQCYWKCSCGKVGY